MKAGSPLEIRDFDIPVVEPGAMLVRMHQVAICGTDVHMWRNPATRSPMIFGHENLGVVEKLGGGVSTDGVGQPLAEGDRVVFGGKMPCGRCYICAVLREPTVCESGIGYGTSPCDSPPFLRGGYGEYVYLVPGASVVKIPAGVSWERAMLAVVGNRTILHGFERAGPPTASDTVVIQGSGPIGLAALIQTLLAGSRRIIMVGAPENRLKIARDIGADEVVNIDQVKEPEERVRLVFKMTEGRGGDYVIEASGGSTAVDEGLKMIRTGGRYLVIGQATDYGARAINPYPLVRKLVRVFGSWAATSGHLYRAVIALEKFDYPVEKLVTHRYSLKDATEGLKATERFEPVIAVINPHE